MLYLALRNFSNISSEKENFWYNFKTEWKAGYNKNYKVECSLLVRVKRKETFEFLWADSLGELSENILADSTFTPCVRHYYAFYLTLSSV